MNVVDILTTINTVKEDGYTVSHVEIDEDVEDTLTEGMELRETATDRDPLVNSIAVVSGDRNTVVTEAGVEYVISDSD